MKRKHIPVLAAVLAICIVIGFALSVRVSAVSAPSLFHNDEKWYKDSSACLEVIDGIFYVPVDVFGMFSHIELSIDSRRGEFMLYNRTSGRYISVLFSEKIATVDGREEIYLNLYKLHGGYYYVPAEYFCSVMELYFETAESAAVGAGMTFRICDGNETQTLAELLAQYDPVSDSTSDTEDTPVTRPPVPPVTSDLDETERNIYLTFNSVNKAHLPAILSALREASVQATFFFTPEELSAYRDVVVSVLPDGHTVALTCGEIADVDDFLDRMNAANEILYGITKTKTRIVQLPAEGDLLPTAADMEKIFSSGYVLWDYTYDVPDSAGYPAYAVKQSLLSAVRKSEINVLRMSTNKTVAEILPDLLRQLAANERYHLLSITASSADMPMLSET